MPEITAEKFIINPYEKGATTKMYKTGDHVRWLPDGNIEYLGRIDEQIKIHGYRIEIGEIESQLQQSGFVRQGVVAAIGESSNSLRLVGYVVTDNVFDKEALVAYLRSRLPEYMVPVTWIEIERFSLTTNGKIDKKALPIPDKNDLIYNEYVAPRNEMENKLTSIWKELLKVNQVGITDNFFELGGHSLLAMRVISSIRSELGVELAIKDLFIYPTIMALAGQISTKEKNALISAITLQKRPGHIPLSFSQERVWFIDQLEGSLQYHLPTVLNLSGNLNRDALIFALQNIINRHEILRTVILKEDGNGYQYINPANHFEIDIIDGSKFSEDGDGGALHKCIKDLINKPFDLSADHMLRATLITLERGENLLVVTMHHIASDGWSRSVMVKEVAELYNSFVENRSYQLPKMQLQYADYAVWQRLNFNEGLLMKEMDYWRQKLQNISYTELPVDFQRPPIQSTRGANYSFHIDKDLSSALYQLSRQQGCTIFMTLLTTLKVLLYRYTNSCDICVGIPVAGRQQKQLEGLIGFFVNTLALRTQLEDNIIFTELLRQVKTTALEAFEHQEIPFEKVVEAVVHERDMSRNPLFQVMLVLQNTPEVSELNLKELTLSRLPHENMTSNFDITFFITEIDEGFHGNIEYCTDLFALHTIQQMVTHFKELLSSVVKTPLKKLSDLTMLSKAEQRKLLVEFNNTSVPYPMHETVVSLFKKQVERTPGNIAIVFENKKYTYKQLHELSNQLAHLLRNKGIEREAFIPICIERGLGLMVGILGILKAGGVYVPVDPEYPSERINYMIEDLAASLVITSPQSKNKLTGSGGFEILELDESLGLLDGQCVEDTDSIESHRLAYVIYTSGSTGRPKGAGVFHRSIVNLLHWYVKEFLIKEEDNVIIISSHAFDLTQKNLLGPLLVGATVVMPEMDYYDTQIITKCIRENAVTILNCAPHAFYPVVDDATDLNDLDTLRLVVLGGEPIHLQRLEKWILKNGYNCEIVNSYGPTECTDIASFYRMKNPRDYINRLIPMGHPNDNVQLFILDKSQQLLPAGLMGEIYIGGDGVGAGYLTDEKLTRQKFIINPFSNKEGSRLYKTGDLGKWLPDGNIEYLGRIDDQVKIRGYRIELGEIENLLRQHEQVQQAVVLAKEDHDGNKLLIGYLVAQDTLNKEQIISFLRERVPAYMIPAFWILMGSFPLTPNGKVDKKALPDPGQEMLLRDEYVPPRNEIEENIAAIWKELLHVERIGIYDNFFELGGHSLLAMRVVSSISKKFGVELAIRDLFQFSTINELGKYLEVRLSVYTNASTSSEYDLLNI